MTTIEKAMNKQDQQRQAVGTQLMRKATIAAHINNMADQHSLQPWQTNAAVRMAISIYNSGNSAATAVEVGIKAIRTIATHHASSVNASPL